MRTALRIGAVLLACALAGGCDSPFPDETLVERLRLLAVAAEPPEAGVTDTLAFRALVADPRGAGRPLEYTWAVCFLAIGYAAADVACPGPGNFPLEAEGDGARLAVPELVAWLMEQDLPVDPGDPGGGEWPEVVTLLVGLEVSGPPLADQDGPERVRALKRFHLRLSGQASPNHNPALAGLSLDGLPWDEAPGPNGVPELQAGSEHLLRPEVLAGSVETFSEGEPPEEVQETLLFSWFSTGGEFRDQRTLLDPLLYEDLAKNRLKAPEEPGRYDLWLVVRDDRLGAGWLQTAFEVVPAPDAGD
ncbi:MAG TPA: hypothetical protein PK668_25955 [Myxococcota bacterium]|nr:hypothetical protein [Myxococcota bacterium]HRY96971.1 hypothetical protein [Myxococcota bacterium]HSA22529.1 hypothetical protein [Myxococcota bacterium]